MRAFVFSTIAILAAVVRAAPESVGPAPSHDGGIVDMVFKGPAVVGGPNVTLSGTAQSIYEQLLVINPQYNPWDFTEYEEKMGAMGFVRGSEFPEPESRNLMKRGSTNCNPVGKRVGNVVMQCTEGYLYLRKLNGWCGAPRGWGGCSRVSCSTNCGIFLCNDNSYPISVWCGNIAGDYLKITSECAITLGGQVSTCKGQVFRDGPPSWNTILKAEKC